jgi:hypothetical protein
LVYPEAARFGDRSATLDLEMVTEDFQIVQVIVGEEVIESIAWRRKGPGGPTRLQNLLILLSGQNGQQLLSKLERSGVLSLAE